MYADCDNDFEHIHTEIMSVTEKQCDEVERIDFILPMVVISRLSRSLVLSLIICRMELL